MIRIILLIFLTFSILSSQFSISFAQSWKELMDSTKFYQGKRYFETALKWAKLALPQAEKEFGKSDTNYISTLGVVVDIFYQSGKLDSAIYYQDINLKFCRIVYQDDHPNLAYNINNMAGFYKDKGNYTAAEPLFIEALEMRKRLFKGDHSDKALSINNLANIYDYRGNMTAAEPLYKEALEMCRRLFKGDHQLLALIMNNMAFCYTTTGNYTDAEHLFKEVLEMAKRLFKNDHPDLARSINNMAGFYDMRGNYTAAEPLLKEALEMARQLFKNDHPDLARIINNLALFYNDRGNYIAAETLFKEALEMTRRLFKNDHPDLARSINNMALLYHRRGNFASAEPLYKEALDIDRRLFKNDHPSLAATINNIAILYNNRGEYTTAEHLLKEALEMRRRLFKNDYPVLALSIKNMAFFYDARGDYTTAEPLYKEAIVMSERLYKDEHPILAKSLTGLANLYQKTGKPDSARLLLDRVYDMTLKRVQEYFPYLNEQQKVDFWANTMEDRINIYYNFGTKYFNQKPEIAEKLADINLTTKGIVLNSTQKALSKARKTRRTLDDWQNARQFWLHLVQNPQKAKKMGINVDSVGQVASELEKEISGLSEEFRKTFDTTLVRWKEVQGTLNPDEATIELVRVRGDKDTVNYLAIITKKDSKIPDLAVMDYGKELEEIYIKNYASLINKQRNGLKLNVMDIENLGMLYNKFWKPVQNKIPGIKTVYISLDGVYNEFNLNTLLNPETKKYVVDEIDLRLITSSRDLVKRNTPLNPLSRGENKVKLFGDPAFELKKEVNLPDPDTTGLSKATRNYYLGGILNFIAQRGISPLPGTKVEIKKISNDFASKNWKVEDYLGEAALEENIKNTKNPRILHIATHGVFLKDVEYLTQEMEFENKKYVENPLLRSMLLFAGAENTIKGETSGNLDRDDGILTAFEAMNLDLDNTELVVLSACETGLGEVRNGEGVYGLQRAFQVAGAKSLIMSLWTVSDAATQELMTSFYEKWLSGMSKRDAFRTAQQELKRKYPGFYYWGAFVMVGE